VATDDEDFERAVAYYIERGMPQKHRLSVDAYRAKCRSAWDVCKTDGQHQTKLLTDHLASRFTVPTLGEGAYIDETTWRSLAAEKPSKRISCIAVGRVPLLSSVRGAHTSNQRAPRHYLSGNDLWIIALFDVLGFEAAYRRLGIEELYRLYEQLISKIVLKPNIDSFSATHEMGKIALVNYFRLWVGFHYFSDTIMLWCPATTWNISPFLTRCSDLFIEALQVGLPLRGAISVGEANLAKGSGIFIGQPIIECARLESSQNWLGVSLSRSCARILEHIDSDLIFPCTPPIKPSGDDSAGTMLHAGIALDWPRRARATANLDVGAVIEGLNTSPAHRLYYDNAAAFVRQSAQGTRWNRDGKIFVIFGALRSAIVAARLAQRPFPRWASAMIDMIETQKEYGRIVGDALRRAATAKLAPSEIERLPSGPRQFITEVESIVDGRGIDLQSLAIATVEARFGICDLDNYHRQILDNPQDSKLIKASLQFLSALLSGGKAIPKVPAGVSRAERKILSMARTMAAGESLPIDAEGFLAAVMYSVATGSALEPSDQKRLEFIAAKGEPWCQLSCAIRSMLDGKPIHAPKGMLPSEVATTVQMLEGLVANSRQEFHSAKRAIARVQKNVDIGVLRRLVEELQNRDAEGRREGLAPILAAMEASGHPHDAVARFVRRLVEDPEDIVYPGGLPRQVQWFLRFLAQIVGSDGYSVPIDLIASMIGNARAGRAGNDCYGLALVGALMADEGGGPHLRAFLEALVSQKELPLIPSDVSNDTVRGMETMLLLVEIEDIWSELRGLADGVADSRLNGTPLEDQVAARIQALSSGDKPYASFAGWLCQLASGSEQAAVPDNLPEHFRDGVNVWRLKSIAKCSLEAVMDLGRAAVRSRMWREQLSDVHKGTLASLKSAGGIYTRLAEFIQKLCRPHAMPPVPMGLPPELLSAFASARREVFWREGAGVILPRPDVRKK
jgi:hypothetical protein